MFRRMLTGAVFALGLLAGATAASADLYTLRPFQKFPECDAANVYYRIKDRFNWAENKTFHYGVEIDRLSHGHQRGLVTFGPYPIPRRYCQATAWLTNGRRHKVYYRIEEGMGLAGTGYKVEFCLPGYDRWRVYDGNCRVLRAWYQHR